MKKSTQYIVGGASAIIILAGLKLGADLINPILIALLLAICIAPLPEWLNKKGLNQNVSLTLSFILILASGILIVILVTYSLAGLSESLPVYEQKLTEIYNNLVAFALSHNIDISKVISGVNISPEKIIGFGESLLGGVSGVLSSSIVIIMLIMFFVLEMVGYAEGTRTGQRDKVSRHDWWISLGIDLRKYISINALNGVILAGMNFIFLLIMGIDFAFLWAFFSFFMNFVPNIGFVFSVIPPALIALITLGPMQALIVLVGFFVANFIVENVIGPMFMKQSLNISLLNSFLSLLVWSWVLGAPGAILGIPLTIVIMKIQSELKTKPEVQ